MQSTLITREAINKNIKYTGCTDNNDNDIVYDYDDLCREIDRFKNILQHNNAKKGQSIFNFLRGMRSLSLFFASSELGLVTCVVDISPSSYDLHFANKEYIDAKSKSVMPINFVIVDDMSLNKMGRGKKRTFYCDLAENVILYDEDFDSSPNNTINATDESTIVKTCSSGTTGTPKSISHSHSFIYNVAKRNSKSFYGNVMSTKIFHHSSSFATFFLPSVLADNVEFIHHEYKRDKYRHGENFLKNIDHIQLPYPNDVRKFLEDTTSDTPNLNVYTLSKMKKSYKKYLGKKVKDVISLFGSSETSGPIFTQNLSDDHYEVDRFIDPDGWYDIKIIDGKLNLTGDKFECNDDGSYKFLGRDDVVTIGGQDISLLTINQQANKLIGDCHVTLDTKFQKVYLCVWNDEDDLSKQIEEFTSLYSLDIEVKTFSKDYSVNFYCGIKIDNESIRDHFRWLT